jgi:ADP-ribose pyrophosphatase YjhB (NUDIX family)
MCPSGFIEYGEHPEEAIRREVLEETGLETTAIELTGVDQAEDIREPGHFVFAYRVTTKPGKLKTDMRENHAIQWFDVAELPEIAWPTQKLALTRLGILK